MQQRYTWAALLFMAGSMIPSAFGQSSFDLNVGFGTARVGAVFSSVSGAM